MNRAELKRAVRLVYRHRQRQAQISELEEILSVYLLTRNTSQAVIANYRVSSENGRLEIEELPRIDGRQLDLLGDYFCLERSKGK